MESMVLSRHNLVGRLRESDSWFIANLLSGQADLLEPEVGEALSRGEVRLPEAFREKGYLVDPVEEEGRYRRAYLDFLDRREQDEIQVFFAPHFACNLACDYCYQDGYNTSVGNLAGEVIDAFFAHLDRQFRVRNIYLTLFGGEPLLGGEISHGFITDFLKRAGARNLDTAIVTNGYTLTSYLPLLRQHRIREIQVTLDGVGADHDLRRPLKGGGGTFDAIVAGIDGALEAGLTVNLRVVLDRRNLASLSTLADLAIERGWTGRPTFKTQFGRNYELHTCQSDPGQLFTRAEFWEALHELIVQHPQILEFHRPAFSVSRFLWQQGELPSPLFDACPGTKTEWAFDGHGRIYACTATIGKSGEDLGTFWPSAARNQSAIDEWQARDTLAMDACRVCPSQLACGGGCAAVAKHQHGTIAAPDCRPILPALSNGLSLYFEKLPQEPSCPAC